MNKILLHILLYMGLTVIGRFAFADEVKTALPLGFATAIKFGINHRIELKTGQESVNSASAKVKEISGLFLPTVDVFSAAQRIKSYDDFSGVNVLARFNGVNIPISVTNRTPGYQLSTGIELSYNLYNGGLDEARLTESKAAYKASEAQLSIAKNRIILDVTYAYWTLRKSQISVQSATKSLQYAEEDLLIAKEQFHRGQISQADLNTKVLAKETKEIELRNETRKLKTSARRYAYALGSDALDAPNFPLLDDVPTTDNINKLFDEVGIIRAPELIKAKSELESAKARISQIQAEYEPVVDLSYRFTGIGRADEGFGQARDDFSKQASIIGVRLKWNWFNGYQTSNRAVQAASASERLRLNVEQTQREIINDRNEKSAAEADLQDFLLLAHKQLIFAEEKLKIATKRWETQQISTLQYQNAQLANDEAISKKAVLEIDLFVAQIALRLSQTD